MSLDFINKWKIAVKYNQDSIDCDIETETVYDLKNYNIDIVEKKGQKYQLRQGLVKDIDYIIISNDIMNIFKAYKGFLIKKKAYKKQNNQKIVQVYERKIKYFFIQQHICQQIDIHKQKYPSLEIGQIYISHYQNVKELKKLAVQIHNQKYNKKVSPQQVRIWRKDRTISLAQYYSKTAQQLHPQSINKYLIDPKAQCIDNEFEKIIDMNISDDDIIIFEVKLQNRWILRFGQIEQKCKFCENIKKLIVKCKCQTIKYCSQQCLSKDEKYHKKSCPKQNQQSLLQQNFIILPDSRMGLTGLQNLGNTCYMNSCLQCLSHTQQLTQYFLQKKFIGQINNNNPIGTKGKITLKYAKLIQQLWCGTNSHISPYFFKSTISQLQCMFQGNKQHDSQQLLSYILDGLHQDLNRIHIKPYVQNIQNNQKSDYELAKENWKNYLLRNKSIIVDLFIGQFKSKVTCPDCNHQSTTFDPFSTISLPIPINTTKTIQSFVFFHDYRISPKKITIQYQSNTLAQWTEYIGKTFEINPKNLKFYILSFEAEVVELNEQISIQVIRDKLTKQKQNQNLFCIQFTDEQINISPQNLMKLNIKIVKIINQYTKTNKQTLTYKRPFFMNKEIHKKGQDIYRRFFSFIYIQFIKGKNNSQDCSKSMIYQKQFKTCFNQNNKIFQVYLMSERQIHKFGANPQYRFTKQRIINFHDNISELLQNLQVFEIQIRFTRNLKVQFKRFNIYEQFDKNKSKFETGQKIQYSLMDCLKIFKQNERLQLGNQWYCQKCKQHKQAFKQLNIYKTSKILIIHLKKFRQKTSLFKQKLNILIKFPHQLDLKDYILSPGLPQNYLNDTAQKNVQQSTKYQLYAVSNHYGSMLSGHYTTYAKNRGQWYQFNDIMVKQIKKEAVVSNAGYMLFYRRF